MIRPVVLSIQGRQRYADQEPELIELVTEGTMEFRDGGWDVTYEESARGHHGIPGRRLGCDL